ncbi:glycoside hydrolase [Bimuria novae-zelandiae CBS 107.79]|uniref:chitinase n=1 Tax=Bimuria novae-zelandiae CBS 107.79 TaxID=1447943 RepID=A0A6A5UVI8_9PLEO|nr:glycoside hydrolase [Bimuria novae-zelandiae CBS 107.79]
MAASRYSHIHFAFANIYSDFKVAMAPKVNEQFVKFMKTTSGVKKILNFGGWSFSTNHDTRPYFGRLNVVQFLKDNKLDDLDFDWEYPGATDISGSVLGSPEDGVYYLRFLQSVKAKLPASNTLSIALPASYWYLRNFPVDKMSATVDYFIHITYDLHGQWDYGSKDVRANANPGCPTGNCLRSHVNLTETMTALSMVTKAGVQASKIMIGVSSYGRSFKVADRSCTGVNCKFTGSNIQSDADPGDCTATSGYIADAELNMLLDA